MRILIQRVSSAKVIVGEKTVGRTEQGMLVMLGLEKDDDDSLINKSIDKILNLRLWSDGDKGFDKSIVDIDGGILLVSQFTLLAETNKGNRPDFGRAMPVNQARVMYNRFFNALKEKYTKTEQGEFQALMQVVLVNDGPVTIIIEMR